MIKQSLHTIDELKAFVDQASAHFSIPVDEREIVCESILRVMPRKRVVIKGQWQSKSVAVKIFFSHFAKQHVEREAAGARSLMQADIFAPKILYEGPTQIEGVWIVIFEWIDAVTDLETIWQGADDVALKKTLQQIQSIFVKQHQAGIYHVDLHPNNFVIAANGIYIVDVADVKRAWFFQKNLSLRKSIANLVLLYAQLPIRHTAMIFDLFEQYCDARQWSFDRHLQQMMQAYLFQARRRRMQNMIKRCFRNCKGIVAHRDFNVRWAYREAGNSEALQTFLKNPDAYLTPENMVKGGRTCTVAKIKLNGQAVIVKRYNIKNVWHGFKKGWYASRAARSWQNANVLDLLGIPTAKPIACYEKRWLGFFHREAYFLCAYHPGELLLHYFRSSSQSVEKVLVAKRLVEILKCFAEVRIAHRDLKATNFILSAGQQPIVIDLDAMCFYAGQKAFSKAYQNDWIRWMQNWKAGTFEYQLFAHLMQNLVD